MRCGQTGGASGKSGLSSPAAIDLGCCVELSDVAPARQDDAMEQRVTILGAGFSKAMSDAMPLTDKLGDLVLKRIASTPNFSAPRSYPGCFEAWLSRLAEDQPDLNAASN